MTSTKKVLVLAALVAATILGRASGDDAPKHPGTEEGAKALLGAFLKPDADAAALTKALRPTTADFAAAFEGDFAAAVEKMYAEGWESGKIVIARKPDQTDLKVVAVPADDLKAWKGTASKEFPGGYQKVGPKLKSGPLWVRWKFTKPGEDLGMAYDGLVYVNDHWVWFPKPWRAL